MRLGDYLEFNDCNLGQIFVSPETDVYILTRTDEKSIALICLEEGSNRYCNPTPVESPEEYAETVTKQDIITAINGTPKSYDKQPKDESFLNQWQVYEFGDLGEVIKDWIKKQV